MPSVFVDTNLLLYVQDAAAPAKGTRALRWLEALTLRDEVLISPQVVNEFITVSLKRFRGLSRDEVHARARELLPWCRVALDGETTALAMAVQTRYETSWWDALIVASALQAGCRYLLSEDLQPGMSFGTLTVINPFETTPEAILS
jgi:predicted nucleic acid-binding protein